MKKYIFECGHSVDTPKVDRQRFNTCPICGNRKTVGFEVTCATCGEIFIVGPWSANAKRCEVCRIARVKATALVRRYDQLARGGGKSHNSSSRSFRDSCKTEREIVVNDKYTALWASVLEQAVKDLFSNDRKSSLDKLKAKRWFKSKEHDLIGSFEWICGVIEFDVAKTRSRILAMRAI